MTMIKAIDTKYAGCLFRSRLEARWAVAFDHLGVAWEYEPQGYEVTHRITGQGGGSFRYLPDFWLPELDAWAEVKGSLTRDEGLRLIDAAASLSSPAGGCGGGKDLVVFGPLSNGRASGTPIRLHMHKGDLEASCWKCGIHTGVPVACDDGTVAPGLESTLLRGYGCSQHIFESVYVNSLDAARTARFEHSARPRKAGRP